MNIYNFLHIHVISFQLNSVNKSSTTSFIVYLKLKYWNRPCSSFSEQIHNIRVLWNDLAFKSFLYSLSIHFYQVRYPALSYIDLGFRHVTINFWSQYEYIYKASHSFDQWRFHRTEQFLKTGETHMQKVQVFCPNSTATRALLFRARKQSNIWATVCVSKPFTTHTHTPNGWGLLIVREFLDTMKRKLDERDRSWHTFTHRPVRNGSLGGPVLKWPRKTQEDWGIVGGFPDGSIFHL